MKRLFSLTTVLIFVGLMLYAQPTTLNLQSPGSGDSYRVGRTVTLKWDTTNTFNNTFVFYTALSQSGPWTVLPLKGGNEFTDVNSKNKSQAAGSVLTVLPRIATTSLFIKMELKSEPSVFDINGPISIVVPQASTPDSILKGNITGTVTLKSNKIYGLEGVLFVQNGGVLRIEPGTIIFGQVGATSAICFNRGGKIYAKGTPNAPIVMTSGARPGQRDRGDWGGLLIMGRAKTNKVEAPVEGGIADNETSKTNGWYGGNDDSDSSGVLSYLRIEFAGIAESPDNELNGLTMGAVGNKTVLDHIQVSYGGDDSFEWFGGSVNAKYLIAYAAIDDDFDTDNGYCGKVQFGLVKRLPEVADQSNSEAFESDNDANSSENEPFTQPVFSNVTAIGGVLDTSWTSGLGANQWNPKYLAAMQIRRNSRLSCFNSVFIGWPRGLEMTNNNTVRAAGVDSLAVRNCSFYGIKDESKIFYFGSGTTASGAVDASWLMKTGYGNEMHNGAGDVTQLAKLENGSVSNNLFDPSVQQSAAYLTTANFNVVGNIPINDPFFDKVAYRGAFDMNRWDTPWAEYDPVNKEYLPSDIVEDLKIINSINVEILPQPVLNYAAVKYYLPTDENVTIKFYNSVGMELSTFISNNFQFQGYYEFGINTSNLENGMYFLRIQTNNSIVSKRIVVLK